MAFYVFTWKSLLKQKGHILKIIEFYLLFEISSEYSKNASFQHCIFGSKIFKVFSCCTFSIPSDQHLTNTENPDIGVILMRPSPDNWLLVSKTVPVRYDSTGQGQVRAIDYKVLLP